jgi:hypothetical protein
MNKQIPPECPGPSDSAERPDGWYWIHLFAHNTPWVASRWRSREQRWMIGAEYLDDQSTVVEVGPRIPSPDEPPCPVTPQRVREIADWIEEWSTKRSDDAMAQDLRYVAQHMERKGA